MKTRRFNPLDPLGIFERANPNPNLAYGTCSNDFTLPLGRTRSTSPKWSNGTSTG